MRKAFLFFELLLATLTAGAQDIELTPDGAYERKEVVTVDSVSAAVLYDRAMMALTDWTGPDGKAKVGIDYQNQETHTLVYKGTFSLGFKNTFLGDGWERYADFTLKVRCKDGRAQVTVTVPTVTAIYNTNGVTRQNTYGQLVEAVNKSRGKKHERGVALLDYLTTTADELLLAMTQRLKEGNSDDDF